MLRTATRTQARKRVSKRTREATSTTITNDDIYVNAKVSLDAIHLAAVICRRGFPAFIVLLAGSPSSNSRKPYRSFSVLLALALIVRTSWIFFYPGQERQCDLEVKFYICFYLAKLISYLREEQKSDLEVKFYPRFTWYDVTVGNLFLVQKKSDAICK
ncbi:hypothetical protein HN011_011633 [Eciton burchellii]|nr:hypothetical protein HN011_011633 [Eciton burchellii]